MAKTLSVAGIKEGTVIDHMIPGSALKILQLLQLDPGHHPIAIGLNLTSASMNFKDLIKIQNRFLSKKEINDIAVFAPKATINLIKNYKIENKLIATLPSTIERILLCPNPRCITNHTLWNTRFKVEEHKTHVVLHCYYCEKMFLRDEIKEYRT